MQELIVWTLIGGFLIFGLGLTSAISSRKQSKLRKDKDNSVRVESLAKIIYVTAKPTSDDASEAPSAISMAASGGQLNGKDIFASIGNHTR